MSEPDFWWQRVGKVTRRWVPMNVVGSSSVAASGG
jgi:hypothetical protein